MIIFKTILRQTPVGDLSIYSDNNYIIMVSFDKYNADDESIKFLEKHFKGYVISTDKSPQILDNARQQLMEYFANERKDFDIPIKFYGTTFYKRVWEELCKIPYGNTISYKELAIRVQSPKGFRAVGQANHNNPISIIAPCHRVIGSNATLTGYGGGLDKKKYLLDFEKANV